MSVCVAIFLSVLILCLFDHFYALLLVESIGASVHAHTCFVIFMHATS